MEATHSTRLDPASRELLLHVAAAAIESGLGSSSKAPPDARDLPADLLRVQASFVTLTIDGRLRGCCGALEPRQLLATDVWHNAQASAFRDPRFEPLQLEEWRDADLEVAVLSPLDAHALAVGAGAAWRTATRRGWPRDRVARHACDLPAEGLADDPRPA